MGNRKKIVASVTGAAALLAAPFIHMAFGLAAESGNDDSPTTHVSASTNEATSAPTSNSDEPTTSASTDNGEKDQDSMPVSVSTEINNGQATVTVNGESTVVSDGDSLHKTISDDNSKTTITITNQDGNVSSSTNSTSGRTRVNSRTSNKVNVTTKVSDTETIH